MRLRRTRIEQPHGGARAKSGYHPRDISYRRRRSLVPTGARYRRSSLSKPQPSGFTFRNTVRTRLARHGLGRYLFNPAAHQRRPGNHRHDQRCLLRQNGRVSHSRRNRSQRWPPRRSNPLFRPQGRRSQGPQHAHRGCWRETADGGASLAQGFLNTPSWSIPIGGSER